jgi:glyoxylase-like metal-dependent hydrolase (beta-lactamase superfamily II)
LGLVATKESIPDAQVFLHPEDSVWYESLSEQAKRFGLNSAEQPEKWDIDLSEGDVMELGELRFDVMHTPGHAPGHCCFLEKSEGVLLAGDLLFKGSMYVVRLFPT